MINRLPKQLLVTALISRLLFNRMETTRAALLSPVLFVTFMNRISGHSQSLDRISSLLNADEVLLELALIIIFGTKHLKSGLLIYYFESLYSLLSRAILLN